MTWLVNRIQSIWLNIGHPTGLPVLNYYQEFLGDTQDHGKLVVHGHTAVKFPEHAGNRVNLDGGTGFGRPLYPAVFENGQVWLLSDRGRQTLAPQKL